MTSVQFLLLTISLYYINGVISRTCKCTHFNEPDCDLDKDCKWSPDHTVCRSIQWYYCEMDEECKENRDPNTGEPDPDWPWDCPLYESGEDGEPTRSPIVSANDQDEDKNTHHNNKKTKHKENDEDDVDDEDFLPVLPATTDTDDAGLPDCAGYGELTNQECGCAASGICMGLECMDGPDTNCQNGGVCCCAPKDPYDKKGYCEGVNEGKGQGGPAGGGGGGSAGGQQPPPQGGMNQITLYMFIIAILQDCIVIRRRSRWTTTSTRWWWSGRTATASFS